MQWDSGIAANSPAYRIAVEKSRFVRVVAGPGTGKSFALKRRVARLLEEGVIPERILPVTFTNVAAEDLQRELLQIGVDGCEAIRGSTLHALGMRILGRQRVFRSTGRVVRPLNKFEMEPLLYDLPRHLGNKRQRAKRIKAYEAAWARLQHEEPGFAAKPEDQEFEHILINWLRFHRGMLIGEIIPQLYEYLRNNPAAPERRLYDCILVDEYQDLNRAEQGVIDHLSEVAELCIVGDDDQSLYSFKHAHPAGIRTFPDRHPGTADHEILDCHRCPTRVVAIANSLIAQNQDRVPRRLNPIKTNGPGEVNIIQYNTLEDEAVGVAEFIGDQISNHGRLPGDILVLAQRRSIGNPIHAALMSLKIPSKSYYQEGAIDSIVAQERLAALKLLADPQDRIALRWLLGYGGNEFRYSAYARVRSHCEQHGIAPWDLMCQLASRNVELPHTRQLIQRFEDIRADLDSLRDHEEFADFVKAWLPEAFGELGAFRSIVAEIVPLVNSPQDLLSLIIEAVAQPEIPPDVTEVRIMSLHKSKGLSSPVVVIAGCIEGLLPAAPDPDQTAMEQHASLEEQRRLFYVGITRVKARLAANQPGALLLTSSRSMTLADAMSSSISPAATRHGRAYVHTSRFIRELGQEAPPPERG